MIDPAAPDFDHTPAARERPRFDYAPADDAPPAVSIVTPLFNPGPELEETAESVFRQSFQQWEWIIVDDGSTDPVSRARIEAQQARDRRVRVLRHPENRGLSAARNTAVSAARAAYVQQLDGDDLLEPTAVEKSLWCLESRPEFAFAKGYCVGFGAAHYLWRRGFHEGDAFLRENLVEPAAMIRRDVYLAIGGHDERIRDGLEDWDFWLRAANHGHWGVTIPEFLNWYRRRPGPNRGWSNLDDRRRRRAFRRDLRRKYPRLWRSGLPRPAGAGATLRDELPWTNRLRKTKPRLLVLVPWLTAGGADKFNLDLVTELAGRGWEVTVAATQDGDQSWLAAFASQTPDVFVLPHFLRPADYPRFLRYLTVSRGVDAVVLSHSLLAYLALPYLRASCPGVAVVDYCHVVEEDGTEGGFPRLVVDCQGLLDLNIVSSSYLKQWLVGRGADASMIEVCHTNVDVAAWRPDPAAGAALRAEVGLDDGVALIVYAARLCPQKRPLVFAETMRRLRDAGVSFVALVAGDGPDRPALRAFVRRHGLAGRVRLLGPQPPHRVRRLLQAADVFFLPSRYEGISVGLFEAMASGVCVVGTDVGGQRELVTPDCGVLLPVTGDDRDAEAYARALHELLGDPERRRSLGACGRARVSEQFRREQMGDRLVTLLAEARRRCATAPRLALPDGLARALAAQAVAGVRSSPITGAIDPYHTSWRTLAYFAIRNLLLPYYRFALARGWLWPARMKDALKSVLDDSRAARGGALGRLRFHPTVRFLASLPAVRAWRRRA